MAESFEMISDNDCRKVKVWEKDSNDCIEQTHNESSTRTFISADLHKELFIKDENGLEIEVNRESETRYWIYTKFGTIEYFTKVD